MAHIPYGYRIERGKAVIDEAQAERLTCFIEFYLSGLSIAKAIRVSGMEMSGSAAREYLRRGTFAGTDYYPPIVDQETLVRVRERLDEQTHPGFSNLPDPVPIKTRFRVKLTGATAGVASLASTTPLSDAARSGNTPSPAELAAHLYDSIIPDEGGREAVTITEENEIRAWVSAHRKEQ